MFDVDQFRGCIVQPALKRINRYSPQAEALLVGICAHESRGGTYVRQIKGPALGVFQMEPMTHDYLWRSYLGANPALRANVLASLRLAAKPSPEEMVHNLQYAAMMARIFFLRFPEPIPETLEGQAALWKQRYNTAQGKGTVEQYIADYQAFTGEKKKAKKEG